MSNLEPGVPPEVDNVHVSEADLAAQPETVLDRVKNYSKAIAAGVAGAVALGIKVATGEDADVGLIDGIEAIVVTLLVYAIPNR